MLTIEGYDVKVFTDTIENSALEQIKQLLSIEVFSDKKIRIMPDVHTGAGCVIGFTGNLGDKVIPNIVGVDIGCGMRVLELGYLDNIDFHQFHEYINQQVPSGKMSREPKLGFPPLSGVEVDIFHKAKALVTQLHCYRQLKNPQRIHQSIGSLGGGNHFIELNKDEKGKVYLVIHTGSRNLGLQVANIYQQKAIMHLTEGMDDLEERIQATIKEYKANGKRSQIQAIINKMRKEISGRKPSLPEGLCYVEGTHREEYLHDMKLCQQWAELNRELIASLLLRFFPKAEVGNVFESVHNYISEDNMIRKGAISALNGQECIIPLNMRDGSLLCTGKGNPDWNYSAPHGAGRILSRSQAYEKISMEDFKTSMEGIYSECVVDSTRDESPMVYKPAAEIISHIEDTVSINSIIRPIFNFKATQFER